jgi:hypothetical protein
MNYFGQHVMGLSEFPDTLSPVILNFGGHIGDGSLCLEISLIRRRAFSLLRLLITTYMKLLEAFSGCGE